ncbi:MAG: N-acetylglucosamine kinase [Bacteroidota bacterium]|nr:N-acetylglucosamine kinase [Bacteroidota bacterium]
MILIADSGSTKTDWRVIDANKKIHQFATQGINPYFQTEQEIAEIIRMELLPALSASALIIDSEIHFYGAGCAAESKKDIVRNALHEVFSSAKLLVETDMLGAARSVCGHQPGIAAILGTGMNSCLYSGEFILENRPSLGYILGDEGSGAHIGKTFIQAYLNQEMPASLAERFKSRFEAGTAEILEAVYKQPMPNRYLASFSKFIYQNLKEQFVIDLVAGCFEAFFDKHICRYQEHKQMKLSCVGSVAFYYSNILRAVAQNKGVNIDTIVETPIAGLTLYHLEEN